MFEEFNWDGVKSIPENEGSGLITEGLGGILGQEEEKESQYTLISLGTKMVTDTYKTDGVSRFFPNLFGNHDDCMYHCRIADLVAEGFRFKKAVNIALKDSRRDYEGPGICIGPIQEYFKTNIDSGCFQ